MSDKDHVPSVDVKEVNRDVTLEYLAKLLEDSASAQEAAELNADDTARDSYLDDRKQQRWIRWIAIGLGILVILGFSCLLYHLVHSVFLDGKVKLSESVLVAVFVTPIVSISTITIFLVVAVFRKFKSKDIENVPFSNIAREAGRHFS